MSGKNQPTKDQIAQETAKFQSEPTPQQAEQDYVHEVYNQIATHFSQTRYKPWPIVSKFLKGQQQFTVGIDVGCGNGKYLNINPKTYIIGSDYSTGLINQASELHKKELNNDQFVADGMNLPHADLTFDFAISIAVIHHFATRERRVDAIIEIMRCLKIGGQALIYCWALEQDGSRRGWKKGMEQDVLVPWVLPQQNQQKKKKKKKVLVKRKKAFIDGVLIDLGPAEGQEDNVNADEGAEKEEKNGDEKKPDVKMRFYHLYKEGELNEDCAKAGGIVLDSGYERDNWWVIVKKV
ncbi:unnamed protein product [Ambrosiozyma monospora]|uniref:Unnamed protein product n=1 Tax=Ambrosiozyma monospora TaxID=43982 RepID=A0ACB5TZQ9_AMBMO|nr:unnamed protein product [Ambrosiozyma monospora]